jgi:dTDP-4-dehydrorhamnose 3,5-epimerase
MSDFPYVTILKRIANPKGELLHVMKGSDISFESFGEAYFTTVNFQETKGWKAHTRMHMNLVVPTGTVRFHLHDDRSGRTTVHDIGEDNYVRLTVPPKVWVAFTGIGDGKNLILNIASIEHDPAEANNAPLSAYPLEDFV